MTPIIKRSGASAEWAVDREPPWQRRIRARHSLRFAVERRPAGPEEVEAALAATRGRPGLYFGGDAGVAGLHPSCGPAAGRSGAGVRVYADVSRSRPVMRSARPCSPAAVAAWRARAARREQHRLAGLRRLLALFDDGQGTPADAVLAGALRFEAHRSAPLEPEAAARSPPLGVLFLPRPSLRRDASGAWSAWRCASQTRRYGRPPRWRRGRAGERRRQGRRVLRGFPLPRDDFPPRRLRPGRRRPRGRRGPHRLVSLTLSRASAAASACCTPALGLRDPARGQSGAGDVLRRQRRRRARVRRLARPAAARRRPGRRGVSGLRYGGARPRSGRRGRVAPQADRREVDAAALAICTTPRAPTRRRSAGRARSTSCAPPADGAGDRRPHGRPASRTLRRRHGRLGCDRRDRRAGDGDRHAAPPRRWLRSPPTKPVRAAGTAAWRSRSPQRRRPGRHDPRAAAVRDGVAEVRPAATCCRFGAGARRARVPGQGGLALARPRPAVDADLEARVAGRAQSGRRQTRVEASARRRWRCGAVGDPFAAAVAESLQGARARTRSAAATPIVSRRRRRQGRARARPATAVAASSPSAMPRRGCCAPAAARSSRRRRSTAGSSTACRSRERPRRRDAACSRPCATPPSHWPKARRTCGRHGHEETRGRPGCATPTGVAARARARRAAGGLLPDPARVAAEPCAGARTPPCLRSPSLPTAAPASSS